MGIVTMPLVELAGGEGELGEEEGGGRGKTVGWVKDANPLLYGNDNEKEEAIGASRKIAKRAKAARLPSAIKEEMTTCYLSQSSESKR